MVAKWMAIWSCSLMSGCCYCCWTVKACVVYSFAAAAALSGAINDFQMDLQHAAHNAAEPDAAAAAATAAAAAALLGAINDFQMDLQHAAHNAAEPDAAAAATAAAATAAAAAISGAINDFQKDLQFRKLNAQKDVIEVKVVRGGNTLLVKNSEVVVGDLLLLDTGESWLRGQRVTAS
jgi:hypothetical protein